jgi:periplasmic divalent cation tolerance protein
LPSNDKAVLIYSTFPSRKAAEEEGTRLVDGALAACVNIIGGMTSIYLWEGACHRDEEAVMIVKTRHGLRARVIEEMRERHPYDNPALLIIPVEGGSDAFIHWICSQTASPGGA